MNSNPVFSTMMSFKSTIVYFIPGLVFVLDLYLWFRIRNVCVSNLLSEYNISGYFAYFLFFVLSLAIGLLLEAFRPALFSRGMPKILKKIWFCRLWRYINDQDRMYKNEQGGEMVSNWHS